MPNLIDQKERKLIGQADYINTELTSEALLEIETKKQGQAGKPGQINKDKRPTMRWVQTEEKERKGSRGRFVFEDSLIAGPRPAGAVPPTGAAPNAAPNQQPQAVSGQKPGVI